MEIRYNEVRTYAGSIAIHPLLHFQWVWIPSAEQETVIQAIAVHAGISAQKDQSEHQTLERTGTMTMYIEAAAT
jgi:hypothetical protein